MKQTQHDPNRRMNPRQADVRHTRTPEEPLGTDDIGMPADMQPDDAREPYQVQPSDTAAHQDRVGRVPLEENQRHPSDPLKAGEEDEYGTRLEKLISKVEPPGREVSDEDILDPGRMTPGAPPVDNRS